MSARYEFTNEGQGVVIDCYGNLISEDLFAVNDKIYKDADATRLQYHLIDLSDLDSLEISGVNLLRLARDDKSRLEANPRLKIAFVCNHAVVCSVVSMWCGYITLGGRRVRQFSDREQAMEWLGETQHTLLETP